MNEEGERLNAGAALVYTYRARRASMHGLARAGDAAAPFLIAEARLSECTHPQCGAAMRCSAESSER
jgi:hypothetical protein